jgi:hypothetical protein
MKHLSEKDASPLRRQAADALRQARKLPVGHDRNDLRQLAIGLLWLERKGLQATGQDRLTTILAMDEPRSAVSSLDSRSPELSTTHDHQRGLGGAFAHAGHAVGRTPRAV